MKLDFISDILSSVAKDEPQVSDESYNNDCTGVSSEITRDTVWKFAKKFGIYFGIVVMMEVLSITILPTLGNSFAASELASSAFGKWRVDAVRWLQHNSLWVYLAMGIVWFYKDIIWLCKAYYYAKHPEILEEDGLADSGFTEEDE